MLLLTSIRHYDSWAYRTNLLCLSFCSIFLILLALYDMHSKESEQWSEWNSVKCHLGFCYHFCLMNKSASSNEQAHKLFLYMFDKMTQWTVSCITLLYSSIPLCVFLHVMIHIRGIWVCWCRYCFQLTWQRIEWVNLMIFEQKNAGDPQRLGG